MIVSGSPTLTLETGSSDAILEYSSGSGSNELIFNYTVASGHQTSDLDYVSNSALELNGGLINDAAVNVAVLTLPAPGANGSLSANKEIVIDTALPSITSVTSNTADGTYKASETIIITINLSEAVTVTGTPQLTLETGTNDAVVDYTSGSGSSTLTFNYTVQSGHNTTDLDYASTSALVLNGAPLTMLLVMQQL